MVSHVLYNFALLTTIVVASVRASPLMEAHHQLIRRQSNSIDNFLPNIIPESCRSTCAPVTDLAKNGCDSVDCICTPEIGKALFECFLCAIKLTGMPGAEDSATNDFNGFAKSCAKLGKPLPGLDQITASDPGPTSAATSTSIASSTDIASSTIIASSVAAASSTEIAISSVADSSTAISSVAASSTAIAISSVAASSTGIVKPTTTVRSTTSARPVTTVKSTTVAKPTSTTVKIITSAKPTISKNAPNYFGGLNLGAGGPFPQITPVASSPRDASYYGGLNLDAGSFPEVTPAFSAPPSQFSGMLKVVRRGH